MPTTDPLQGNDELRITSHYWKDIYGALGTVVTRQKWVLGEQGPYKFAAFLSESADARVARRPRMGHSEVVTLSIWAEVQGVKERLFRWGRKSTISNDPIVNEMVKKITGEWLNKALSQFDKAMEKRAITISRPPVSLTPTNSENARIRELRQSTCEFERRGLKHNVRDHLKEALQSLLPDHAHDRDRGR